MTTQSRTMLAALLAVACQPAVAQTPPITDGEKGAILFIQSERQARDGSSPPERRTGTGFVVSPWGHVVTAGHVLFENDNSHVVRHSASLRSRHNHQYPLQLVIQGPLDVALLMLPDNIDSEFQPLPIESSSLTPDYANLYALGFPEGLDLTIAPGILSTRNGFRGYWQTTMPLNRGQSGGPVFDANGRVVGMAIAGNDTMRGVTYAMPSSYLRGVLQLVAANVDAPRLQFGTETATYSAPVYAVASAGEVETSAQRFCLPEGYTVEQVSQNVIGRAGRGSQDLEIRKLPDTPNCVTASAVVASEEGMEGADGAEPAWLGVDVEVTGSSNDELSPNDDD